MNGHWMEGKEWLLNAAPLLTSILEQTDTGVILADEEGRIIFTNGLAGLLSDQTIQDFTGRSIFDIYLGEEADLAADFKEALAGSTVKARPQKREMAGISLWLEMTYQPFYLCGTRCVLLTASDVTERVAGETRNRRIMAALSTIKSMSRLEGDTHDVDETLKKITRLIVPNLADWCLVDRAVEDGFARNVTIASPMWSQEPLYEICSHYPGEAASDITHDISVTRPIITSTVPESMTLEVSLGEDPMRLKWKIRPSSFAILPLPGHERGTLTLILTETWPEYTDEDRQWMEELARCVATIIAGKTIQELSDSPGIAATMDDEACAVAIFSGDSLQITDANLAFRRLAKAFSPLPGDGEAVADELSLDDFPLDDQRRSLADQLKVVADSGKASSGTEYLKIGRDPETHYIRYSLMPFRYKDGPPYDVMMIGFDVTGEVAAGRKVPELESLLDSALAQNQAILNGIGEGLVILGEEGRVLQLNKTAADLLGNCDLSEFRSDARFDDLFEMLAPDGTPLKSQLRPAARAMAGEAYHSFEVTIRPRNGRSPWTGSFNGIPVADMPGHCRGALLIFRDVTSQKRLETSLKLNEERLAAIQKLNDMGHADVGWLLEFGVGEMMKLTASQAGCMLGTGEDDGSFASVGFSAEAGKAIAIAAQTEKKPLIINDYAGTPPVEDVPEGQAELTRLMCVPVVENGRIVSVAMVANKQKDYDSYDLWQLSLFSGSLWRIISRKQAEDKLKKTLQEIDTRVSKRTEDLFTENQALQKEVTARKNAEDRALKLVKEKEALLKEINHRVKNNMQILQSLINLQMSQIVDEKAIAILKDSQSRIKSMALIHEKLYRSTDFTRVDFRDYVEMLARGIMYSYNPEGRKVRLSLNVEKTFLNIDKAVTCGLIINELITNSYKHAFTPDMNGEIRVDLTMTNQGYMLVVSDNGVGIPETLNINSTPTLGLQLVHMLVDQIGGKLEISRSWGTTFRIYFSAEEIK